jgi:DNA modification methylase
VGEDGGLIAGHARILAARQLGISTVATDVERVLGGVEPHLMVTDPPYGVEYDAGWRNSAMANRAGIGGGAREKGGGRALGKIQNDDRADWREAWALFPGDVAYVWHGSTHVSEVQVSLDAAGFVIRAHLIWAKSQMVIGRGHYHYQHEPCWYAVRKGKTAHWAGDRSQTSVWQIDKNKRSETGHSTQKPVECMRRPIENNSSRAEKPGHRRSDRSRAPPCPPAA